MRSFFFFKNSLAFNPSIFPIAEYKPTADKNLDRMWVVILHYVVAVNLLLTLIEHPTASLTPDSLCPYPAVVCWASVHLSACQWPSFQSLHVRSFFCPVFHLTSFFFLLSFCPLSLIIYPCFLFYPVTDGTCASSRLSLSTYPPLHLPSIYLDAIFMRSGSHPALLSGCTWTLLTNCLFFSCASALFSSSFLLLLPPGCTAGKQCFSSFFLHCAFL